MTTITFFNTSRLIQRLFAGLISILVVIPTSSAQVGLGDEEGLPVVSWQEAKQIVGRFGIVYGEIVDVGHTKRIHFLNFSKERGAFTVVVFDEAMKNFPEKLEDSYLNKKVKIRGMITTFKGEPQIVVAKPEQITKVAFFPESNIPKIKTVTPGNELVIGTFNVENLFDDKDDPYHNDESTPAKSRDDMQRVANMIRELNADVLALQEVENRGYLEKFVNTMLADMGYMHIVHFEGNDGRGIDVCLISRISIRGVTSHRHRVFDAVDGGVQRFNRDVLAVELIPDGGDPFEMWVVHLKSNSGGREQNEPIRLGECRELRSMIAEKLTKDPQASLVLCGDFNDTFATKTIQTILGDGPTKLLPLFDDVPEDQRITYTREPYRSMIDFLFCSPAMAERYVAKTYRIRLSNEEESGTDHNPVVARFRKSAGLPAENTDSPEQDG